MRADCFYPLRVEVTLRVLCGSMGYFNLKYLHFISITTVDYMFFTKSCQRLTNVNKQAISCEQIGLQVLTNLFMEVSP